ncbi:glycosyltransferase [Fusobacterium periodonticum]|uniref:glycosyltransferase n=1 Tax=Fusobacterium periodonticum TaxID=860 RepID=UPI00352FD56E
MTDKITVIVTLYNRLEYARNMILALQQQTKQIDELIFVDDGSSEKLMDFISDLLVDCKFKIKHVYQDDIGFRLARSRNNGAREASGDYLIFLDQDVIFNNDFIESIYNSRRKKRMIFSEALSSSLEEKNKIQELINQKFDYEKIYKLIDNTKKIEQNKIVNKEKLYGILYKLKLRTRGAKIVGLIFSLFKEDFININGLDEKYIGYGYEDDDFGNRFFKYGGETYVFKMKMYPIHMYHKAAILGESPNEAYYRQRKNEISKKNYRCEYGYDKTFGEDKYKVIEIK